MTYKTYTNLKQSKKLAKILSRESADAYYEDDISVVFGHGWHSQHIPCWSLATLLATIPIEHSLHGYLTENGMVYRVETLYAGNSKNYDNPVDACYEMIIKLHEQNLL